MKALKCLKRWIRGLRIGRGGDSLFIANVPYQIEARWDDNWAPRLAGFPLNLLYTGIRKYRYGSRVESCCYWPDLGSFADDGERRSMNYIPRVKSGYWVRVEYDKQKGWWRTAKYSENKNVAVTIGGPEFDHAMMLTTVIGLQPDEPVDETERD